MALHPVSPFFCFPMPTLAVQRSASTWSMWWSCFLFFLFCFDSGQVGELWHHLPYAYIMYIDENIYIIYIFFLNTYTYDYIWQKNPWTSFWIVSVSTSILKTSKSHKGSPFFLDSTASAAGKKNIKMSTMSTDDSVPATGLYCRKLEADHPIFLGKKMEEADIRFFSETPG